MEVRPVVYKSGEDMMVSALLVTTWLEAVYKTYQFMNTNHTPAKIVMYMPAKFNGIPVQILQEGTDDTGGHKRAVRNPKLTKPVSTSPSPATQSDEEE